VQGITELVDGFNGMPEAGQAAVFWVGAVGSGVAIAGGLALLAVPKIAAFKVALADLNITAAGTRAGMGRVAGFLTGPFSFAVVGATLGMEALRVANDAGTASLGDLRNALVTSRDAMVVFEKASQGNAVEQFFTGSSLDALRELPTLLDDAAVGWTDMNLSLNQVSGLNRIGEIGDALGDLARSDPEAASRAFRGITEQFKLTDAQASELLKRMPALREALVDQATAAGETASQQDLLRRAMGVTTPTVKTASDAYQEQADQVEGVRQALADLMDQINAANSVEQQAVQANAAWLDGLVGITAEVEAQRKAYEDANGTLDGFVLSLDESTSSGSANASMLAGLAGDAQTAAKAQFDVDQKTMSADEAAKKYAGTLAEQRRKFEESAVAAGYNADEVKALADKVFALPSAKEVKILADTAAAQSTIDRFIWSNDGRRINLIVDQSSGRQVSGMNIDVARAGGGIIPGAPSNRDNMLAAVATGEFVVRASQVVHPENRRVLEYINAGGRMRGYAMGGFVQPHYASTSGSGYAGAPSFEVHVHAAPGMDEGALVNKAVRKVQELMK
jgi:hypothetical protein